MCMKKQENKKWMNKNTSLDINISNVFIAKNIKKRAFIEQFNYSSVNFTQKDLGNILGFFIVRDNTETSENIVNFLASEIKKKYFSPIQKNAEDKFELTLHHINRTLEEIANIGNVEWLGKIDGAVCVINDANMHFSVTGNAYILLLRDNTLINISEGLAHEEAVEQPLKTFVDISSGEIHSNDKIIITSQELLDLVSLDELQKNAINFGQDNFIQFIETVLTNECSLATTTVIDVYKKEHSYQQPKPIKEIPSNVFSADTFKEQSEPISKNIDDTESEQANEQPSEYIDPRTGHIHIQGDDKSIYEQTIIESTQEKLLNIFDDVKEIASTKWHVFSKKFFNLPKKISISTQNQDISAPDDTEKFDDIPDSALFNDNTSENSFQENNRTDFFQTVLHKIKQIIPLLHSFTYIIAKKTSHYYAKDTTHFKNIQKKNTKKERNKNTKQKHLFLPNIHHIVKLWHNMDTQTKLTAIGILIFIIAVPLIFAKISQKKPKNIVHTNNKNIQQSIEETKETPDTSQNFKQDNIENPVTLLAKPSIISTILLNNRLTGITKNSIVLLTNNKQESFVLPTDSGEIAFGTPMNDLDLIFILTTKNKLYSFSPITKKFEEQKNIPSFNHSEIIGLNTYMTYLYILNKKMIKRHARIENGFDAGKNWLKEDIAISQNSTMAIDDDIYLTQDAKIIKLHQGKKIPFSQDSSIQKVSNVYTTEDTKFMWILDKEHNTLFKTEKSTGKKITKYTHTDFHKATSIVVSEQTNTAIISTTQNILSFKLK